MRTIPRIGLACLGITLVLGNLPALGQEEKPVSLDSTPRGISLSLFDEDPAHRLIITGFGVGTFDYNFNTDTNSFGDSALAIAFAKVISDHISVFGQLTAAREAALPFVGAEPAGDISTDIDNLQLTWYPSSRSSLAVTIGKFDSPIAIERDDAPLNFQATSSWTFDFARPVKFTGIEVYKSFTPTFEGWGMLVNGWDVDRDNNKAKTGAV
jgi:Putative beta-barrel porin-2, OmpL-like. bbp2